MNQPSALVSGDTHKNSPARIIKQLLEAVLFEGVIEYQYNNGYFHFSIAGDHYEAEGYVSGFSRVRLHPEGIWRCHQHYRYEVELPRLIAGLGNSRQRQQTLLAELEHTATLCQWNQQHLPDRGDRRQLPYRQLESAIDEGHPYHPCFKSRTGFSIEDHVDFGPEFGNRFQLKWLAIKRRFVKQRLPDQFTNNEPEFWRQELGEECFHLLSQLLLKTTGGDSEATIWRDYHLLPIHPWQRQRIDSQLQQPLSCGDMIDLGYAGDHYCASISVRTLLNDSQPDRANIKLPLNIVNSSSLRTIEAHSICTAPLLSNWLQTLIDGDPFFKQQAPLILLPEYAGISLQPHDHSLTAEHWSGQLADQLGVIFRQSLELQHNPQDCVPFVALSLTESDSKPFIEPWIARYGCDAWVNQLVQVVVIPVWHLLVKHGIALETHAQNMLLQHDNGWPQKLILRDFHESLEYVASYLAQPELEPDFVSQAPCYGHAKPDQYYWMQDVEALRELLVDTLFVFNLADLAVVLEQHYQFSEQQFWQIVQQHFSRYAQADHCSDARLQHMDITAPTIQTESLIRKKLTDGQEFHHSIHNPLSGTKPPQLAPNSMPNTSSNTLEPV